MKNIFIKRIKVYLDLGVLIIIKLIQINRLLPLEKTCESIVLVGILIENIFQIINDA
jgi:hypothetical protein